MRKRIFITAIIFLVLSSAISGCSKKEFKLKECIDEIDAQYTDLVVTGTGLDKEAEITVYNKSDETLFTGMEYKIQKKEGDKWYDMEIPSTDFTAERIIIESKEKYSEHVNWEKWIGKLPNGTYRIRKIFYLENNLETSYIMAGEFEIK